MTTSHKVIKANDFIRSKQNGEIDYEETKQIFIEIAKTATPPADYEIILDVRENYTKLNNFQIYELVQELVRHRESFREKIAVLCRKDDQIDRANFFELCGQNRGFFIEVFTDFEAVIKWLYSIED